MEKLKIRSSDIAGIRTPAEFYQKKFIHKPVQKDYFDIGTAAHMYILEPNKFDEKIVVATDPPEPDKVNKDGSLTKTGENGKWLKKLKEYNPGKIVFEPYLYDQVIGYANAVKKIPGFDSFINRKTGMSELKMTYDHKLYVQTGTADYVKPGKFIADLKFVKSIDDRSINIMFYEHDYHLRAAWYIDLYNLTMPDNRINQFIYIFIEKSENPTARFVKMTGYDIEAGRSLYMERIASIVDCHKNNDWILNSIETLELPEWVYTKKVNF